MSLEMLEKLLVREVKEGRMSWSEAHREWQKAEAEKKQKEK
jgi:hypothetical protein